ncbi:universal stress protein [Streptomyces sp. PTM05]|uniref:Universal stress protein n=1 Tax=Streptantibioticus parmotrematis TaxID=2873249 RepID=A0ABS7QS29_9ACTN|nr:universal stress protein [Streptantibioticus parmotrematis]MBY8885997.1 universal stress protein [Streptantibioticus parmotrematis]
MMTAQLPLVVGVDGSDTASQAVDWAADEAARHSVPLLCLHGSLWERYEGALPDLGTDRPAEQVAAEDIVASAAARASALRPEVKVTTRVVAADPAEALLAECRHCFGIVVGSRGRGGLAGMLLGSVGLTVAARATCPVVVVRGTAAGRRGERDRVVLGAGDQDEVAVAAAFAFREAVVRRCALDAVHAWRRTDGAERNAADGVGTRTVTPTGPAPGDRLLDDALRDFAEEEADLVVNRETVEGPARKALLAAAACADLLVLGARRRAGHVGLQLGPVNHALLHHSPCPVAVVPQPD